MTKTLKVTAALVGLALLLGSGLSAAQAQQSAPASTSAIKNIAFEKVNDQIQVTITIDGSFTFETLEVQAPQRLVLDFKGVGQIQAQPVVEINDLGVFSIRTGQFQPDVARVVFDLSDPAPSHSLTQTETGLKVIFWKEAPPAAQPEAKPAVAQPAPAKPVETKPAEVKPAAVKPAEVKPAEEKPAAPAAEGGRPFYVRLAGGVGLAGKPDTKSVQNITLYAESGSLAETYALKTGWLVDFVIGKYITPRIQVGAGISYGSADTTATIVGSLPHPFLMGQPREVTFPSTELKNYAADVYVYALFTLVHSEKFSLALGPTLGYGSAKYKVLQDFAFTDSSPFAAADVTITSQTFADKTASTPTAGAWLQGLYRIGRSLYLSLDARLTYFDAKVETLGHRANLSTVSFLLGLQYDF